MTVAQAVVEYLSSSTPVDTVDGQDNRERMIPGSSGSSARQCCRGRAGAPAVPVARPDALPFYQARNEQAQAHQSVGYARTPAPPTCAISASSARAPPTS